MNITHEQLLAMIGKHPKLARAACEVVFDCAAAFAATDPFRTAELAAALGKAGAIIATLPDYLALAPLTTESELDRVLIQERAA